MIKITASANEYKFIEEESNEGFLFSHSERYYLTANAKCNAEGVEKALNFMIARIRKQNPPREEKEMAANVSLAAAAPKKPAEDEIMADGMESENNSEVLELRIGIALRPDQIDELASAINRNKNIHVVFFNDPSNVVENLRYYLTIHAAYFTQAFLIPKFFPAVLPWIAASKMPLLVHGKKYKCNAIYLTQELVEDKEFRLALQKNNNVDYLLFDDNTFKTSKAMKRLKRAVTKTTPAKTFIFIGSTIRYDMGLLAKPGSPVLLDMNELPYSSQDFLPLVAESKIVGDRIILPYGMDSKKWIAALAKNQTYTSVSFHWKGIDGNDVAFILNSNRTLTDVAIGDFQCTRKFLLELAQTQTVKGLTVIGALTSATATHFFQSLWYNTSVTSVSLQINLDFEVLQALATLLRLNSTLVRIGLGITEEKSISVENMHALTSLLEANESLLDLRVRQEERLLFYPDAWRQILLRNKNIYRNTFFGFPYARHLLANRKCDIRDSLIPVFGTIAEFAGLNKGLDAINLGSDLVEGKTDLPNLARFTDCFFPHVRKKLQKQALAMQVEAPLQPQATAMMVEPPVRRASRKRKSF